MTLANCLLPDTVGAGLHADARILRRLPRGSRNRAVKRPVLRGYLKTHLAIPPAVRAEVSKHEHRGTDVRPSIPQGERAGF